MDTDNPLLAARPGHDAVLIRHLLQSKLESFSTLWMCLFLFYYVTHFITILKRTGVFVVVCRKQSLQEYSRLSTQIRWCRSTSVPSYSGWDVSSPAEPRDLVRLHSRNIASHTYIIQDLSLGRAIIIASVYLFMGAAITNSPLHI